MDSPRDGRPQWQATLGDHSGRPQWHATGSPWNTRAPASHTHPMSTPTANSPRCQLAANPFNKCSPKWQRPLARISQKHGLRMNPELSRLRAEEDKLPFRKRRVPCRACTLPSSIPSFLGNLQRLEFLLAAALVGMDLPDDAAVSLRDGLVVRLPIDVRSNAVVKGQLQHDRDEGALGTQKQTMGHLQFVLPKWDDKRSSRRDGYVGA